MSGKPGDLAAGDGFLGEVVDLPGGMVGLALFNEHGRQRRVVYVPSERLTVIMLEQDRPRLAPDREAESRWLARANLGERVRETPDRSL